MKEITIAFDKYTGNLGISIDGKKVATITLAVNLFALGGYGGIQSVMVNDDYQVSDLVIDAAVSLYHAVQGNIIDEVSD